MVDVFTLPDGRRAQFWLGGAAHGPLVVVLHGCPDTRHVAMSGHEAAVDVGVRLLCVNRPGYGASTPTDSTHESVAEDVEVAVRRLVGAPRYGVLGMSVGGGYAVACAVQHPRRVQALTLVSAQGPGTEQTPVDTLVEQHRPGYLTWCAGVGVEDPDAVLARTWLDGLPDGDAAVVGPWGDAAIAASVREALACPEGYLRDAALSARRWRAEPRRVTATTRLWYGEDDDRATPEIGRTLADQLDGELTVTPTTHLATLVSQWPEILDAMREDLTEDDDG